MIFLRPQAIRFQDSALWILAVPSTLATQELGAQKISPSLVWDGETEPILILLLCAGLAYHLHVRDFQVSVLGIVLLHSSIVSNVFRVFFQVVRGLV